MRRLCLLREAHTQWSRFLDDVDDVIPLAVRAVHITGSQNTAQPTPPVVPTDPATTPAPQTNPVDDSGITHTDPITNWVGSFSFPELKEVQLQDIDIAPILGWLESGFNPSQRELRLSSPATRAYWMCKEHIYIWQGVLYYRWEEEDNSRSLLVVPEGLRNQVLFMCHDAKHAGHLGIDKTVARLKQTFHWYGMSRDGREYVQCCHVCNQNKKLNTTPRAPLREFHSGFPMERVHLDILGPFNKSTSGNVYILMIICQFTKWLDIIPLTDQTAETVAREFLAKVISYFGCPLEIFTDQGSNFQSNLFKAFCDLMEITRKRTTPYHPSGNGQVETYNRLVLQMNSLLH